MNQTSTRASTTGAWEVKRRFTLPDMSRQHDAGMIAERLGTMAGVCMVNTDLRRHRLTVVYDIRQTDYRRLLVALADAGFPVPDTWWSRLKARWLQNLDETGRENANAPEAPCCNSAPGVAPGKRR